MTSELPKISVAETLAAKIDLAIGTFAERACVTASLVCGMTPSSAATTRITMSVVWAPRARICEKAA